MAKRTLKLSLTFAEANALMTAGNRGIADLTDAGDDESLNVAELTDCVLKKLGKEMGNAGWIKLAE